MGASCRYPAQPAAWQPWAALDKGSGGPGAQVGSERRLAPYGLALALVPIAQPLAQTILAQGWRIAQQLRNLDGSLVQKCIASTIFNDSHCNLTPGMLLLVTTENKEQDSGKFGDTWDTFRQSAAVVPYAILTFSDLKFW